MQKISVSVVAYANSLPFVYGLLHSKFSDKIEVSIDMPSVCADKLLNNSVDISLVPVAETLRMNNVTIVSDLCIGANDYVKTVLLASNCPKENLKEIYLDYQSRTSVVLIKVLAKNFWHLQPEWVKATAGFESRVINNTTGAVIIGDRTFSIETPFQYDLSHEWNTFTGLPFVFAAWMTRKNIPSGLIEEFNQALHFGAQNISDAVAKYNKTPLSNDNICKYLIENIDYELNDEKKKALSLFLNYAKEFIPTTKEPIVQYAI
jgi:chorismate dehydratase